MTVICPPTWNRYRSEAPSGAMSHRTVLLTEAMEALNIKPAGSYVDATFGRGGHAAALLARLVEDGRLLALDRDPEAAAAAADWARTDTRFSFVRRRFAELGEVLRDHNMMGRADGVLLDIGVSSPQLDDPGRGFSFRQDGPLDMRMDPTSGPSAAQWLASCTEAELARVLRDYGEERFHRRIARAVLAARSTAPLQSTRQLADIIAAAVPSREPGKHPATRSFQAIRILVNRELEELQAALSQAVAGLAAGGRLVAISFHSLEDRLVKRFMRTQSRGVEPPPGIPITGTPRGVLREVGRPVYPAAAEIDDNPRARSAVMRVAERLP